MKHEINSQNTKKMLADMLISLLQTKPISKITVSEIVNLCDINRKTFYYHFQDVYDLLEWHLNNEVSRAASKFYSSKDINDTISYSFDYMSQNPHLKNLIQDPLAREKITHILQKAIYSTVYQYIEDFENAQEKQLDSDCKIFLAKNLTRITILSCFDAIEHPTEYEIEKIQQYITTLFHITTNNLFI